MTLFKFAGVTVVTLFGERSFDRPFAENDPGT